MMYRAYYIFPPYNNKKKENEKTKEEQTKEEQKQKEI